MWKLKNTKKDYWEHYIFVGEECIVGRKEATLLIANDPSVSRKHATLFVRHPEENLGNPLKNSSLFMKDERSKYGTFKNNVRITNEEELIDGDIIKFGQFESEFKIHYVPLVVTTSCLDVTFKNKLKQSVHLLGGHVVSEWQPFCTHLVMSQVKVTVKALCCLISLKDIVLPEYFDELYKNLRSSATTVSPNEFIPPIGESLIDKEKVSFTVNYQRKNIFKDKTFFFIDEKQFKKLHLGITMGGGNVTILSDNKVDINLLLHESSCFIEPVKGQTMKEEVKNFLKKIISALQKKNLRMIPESDIGLAVAYASTETYCNPSFNIGSAVLGIEKITSQTLSEREVYVPDTQEHVARSSPPKRSSLLNLENHPNSKKHKSEALNSSNHINFKEEDAEDIFEIPLSVQVKQELDDIFESTMKAYEHDQNTVELVSTLPHEPQSQEKNNVKEKVSKQVSPVKCKLDKLDRNTSLLNANELLSVPMNADESNLPRNLIKIQFASLIVRKPVVIEHPCRNSEMKNFKKFRKIFPKKVHTLPRIIGGHDLIPYDKDAIELNDNWEDDIELRNNHPIKGAFDWDTQND